MALSGQFIVESLLLMVGCVLHGLLVLLTLLSHPDQEAAHGLVLVKVVEVQFVDEG